MDAQGTLILGGAACVVNFWYSLTRYLWYRVIRRQLGKAIEYSCPLPIVGSLVVGLSFLGVPHTLPYVIAGVSLILIDTGGLHWLIVWAMWIRPRVVLETSR